MSTEPNDLEPAIQRGREDLAAVLELAAAHTDVDLSDVIAHGETALAELLAAAAGCEAAPDEELLASIVEQGKQALAEIVAAHGRESTDQ